MPGIVLSVPSCRAQGDLSTPLLHPIPVSILFQILAVKVMELPQTARVNCYVVMFQDFLTKWPFMFPTPEQKSIRIAHLLTKEVVPFFGMPDALLSDCGGHEGCLSTPRNHQAKHHSLPWPSAMQQYGEEDESYTESYAKEAHCQVWETMGSVLAWSFVGVL